MIEGQNLHLPEHRIGFSDSAHDPPGTRVPRWCSGGSFQKLVIWKNVVKQSCSTYFSDDKNAFGVIPDPLGSLGGPTTKVVRNAFVIKNYYHPAG